VILEFFKYATSDRFVFIGVIIIIIVFFLGIACVVSEIGCALRKRDG